jgi:hypothetical protein
VLLAFAANMSFFPYRSSIQENDSTFLFFIPLSVADRDAFVDDLLRTVIERNNVDMKDFKKSHSWEGGLVFDDGYSRRDFRFIIENNALIGMRVKDGMAYWYQEAESIRMYALNFAQHGSCKGATAAEVSTETPAAQGATAAEVSTEVAAATCPHWLFRVEKHKSDFQALPSSAQNLYNRIRYAH